MLVVEEEGVVSFAKPCLSLIIQNSDHLSSKACRLMYSVHLELVNLRTSDLFIEQFAFLAVFFHILCVVPHFSS